MDETVIAIEKVLGKWLERAIRLARIFFPLQAFVFIGRTRTYSKFRRFPFPFFFSIFLFFFSSSRANTFQRASKNNRRRNVPGFRRLFHLPFILRSFPKKILRRDV